MAQCSPTDIEGQAISFVTQSIDDGGRDILFLRLPDRLDCFKSDSPVRINDVVAHNGRQLILLHFTYAIREDSHRLQPQTQEITLRGTGRSDKKRSYCFVPWQHAPQSPDGPCLLTRIETPPIDRLNQLVAHRGT